MTDIVERLRSRAWEDRHHRKYREEAALEIERMRAERDALLSVLRELVQLEADGKHANESAIEVWERARAAIDAARKP